MGISRKADNHSVHFFEALRQRLSGPLPGEVAHAYMSPPARRQYEAGGEPRPRVAAVLILLFPTPEGLRFPLIRRPDYNGVHSGQMALPGGRVEEEDASLAATARRETLEEIGAEVSEGQMLGQLSQLYIPPSHSLVSPFVAWAHERPNYVLEEQEVAAIHEADLRHLHDPERRLKKTFEARGGIRFSAPYFELDGQVVWGATAMILNELRQITAPLMASAQA